MFVIFLLIAVGATQPRLTAAAFSLCVAAALLYISVSFPNDLPMQVALVVVALGAVCGEAASWARSRIARLRVREAARADAIATLRATLDGVAPQAGLAEIGSVVARAAATLFGSKAVEVHLRRDPPESGDVVVGTHPRRTAQEIILGMPGDPLGVVYVEQGLKRAEGSLKTLFAQQATTALVRQSQLRRLTGEARSDQLTGVGNRRYGELLIESLRPGDAVAVLDVDNFKLINDAGGHRAGDEVLQALGAYLTSAVGSSVARHGGDEFLLILPTAATNPADIAETLLIGWRSLRKDPTISIGLAVHDAERTGADTLHLADQALYRAKELGRDRVSE